MNNARRKKIRTLQDQITATLAKFAAPLAALKSELETQHAALEAICTDEQDAYDRMSERAQEGDNGVRAQDAITAMETATSALQSWIDSADNFDCDTSDILSSLEDACFAE